MLIGARAGITEGRMGRRCPRVAAEGCDCNIRSGPVGYGRFSGEGNGGFRAIGGQYPACRGPMQDMVENFACPALVRVARVPYTGSSSTQHLG